VAAGPKQVLHKSFEVGTKNPKHTRQANEDESFDSSENNISRAPNSHRRNLEFTIPKRKKTCQQQQDVTPLEHDHGGLTLAFLSFPLPLRGFNRIFGKLMMDVVRQSNQI
jgi:hypothetical protein